MLRPFIRLEEYWRRNTFKGKDEKGGGGFLGSPVVKTLPSSAGGIGSIPGRGTKIPHALTKKQKRKE